MTEGHKTKKSKIAQKRALAKRKRKIAIKPTAEEADKQFQMNANAFAGNMMGIFRMQGLDGALITILKIVRPWPSLIDKADALPFVPPFAATQITAEEATEGDDSITTVSFSYLGKSYQYVARINRIAAQSRFYGSIALKENGERVVDMDIAQIEGSEHYSFAGLSVFRMGDWSDNVVRIEQEILSNEKE